MVGQLLVVRHKDQGRALLPVQAQKKLQHHMPVGAIKIAGRLVSQQNGRPHHKRARQGHTLLLASGKLNGVVVPAFQQADTLQQIQRPGRLGRAVAHKLHWQQHILLGGEGRNEMVGLENKSDLAPAHERQLILGKIRDLLAIQLDGSGGRAIETREKTQQRAFAAAGRPHYRNHFTALDIEIDPLQNLHTMAAGVDDFGKAPDLDHEKGAPLAYYDIEMRMLPAIAAVLLLQSCGKPTDPKPKAESTARIQPIEKPEATPDHRAVIAAFGDSLTAGFGVEPGQSYPDFLQRELDLRGYTYRVVNAGVSCDTTTDGLARVNFVLELKPSIVILEFGGNEGLRGIPVRVTKSNLERMIVALRQAGPTVVLAGMTLPPNYGPDYITAFRGIYPELAAKYKLPLIPFLLEGVGGTDYMQQDGLHASAAGNWIVAQNVMQVLEPLLTRTSPGAPRGKR